MRRTARRRKGFNFGGALRCAGVVAAALYLALVQMLSAAHAESGEANTPNHHNSACVLCVAAHGTGHGLLVGEVKAPAAPPAFVIVPSAAPRVLVGVRVLAHAPRGPPSL